MILSTEEIEKRVSDSYELPNRVLDVVPEPLVTVRTSTYQHAPYIRNCIEAVLMQKTTFSVEYIIGEDFSTDGTREIVFEYAKKYPDKIRVFTADYNVGAKANGTRCIRASRGKYMAICEGDDYWTDPLKLQKQVDFLEANLDFSISSHNVLVKYENEAVISHEWGGGVHNNKEIITIEDLLGDGTGGATCSLVFRKDALGELPEWFYKLQSGDTALQILCASKGKMKYFKEVMGVYRKHSGGICSGISPDSTEEVIRFDSGITRMQIINKHFNYRYDHLIRKIIVRYYLPNLVRAHVLNAFRHLTEASRNARRILNEDPAIFKTSNRERIIFYGLIISSNCLILLNKILRRIRASFKKMRSKNLFRTEVINGILNNNMLSFKITDYLEIGARSGNTIVQIDAINKVGVEPNLRIEEINPKFKNKLDRSRNIKFIELTSDDFFKKNKQLFDVIFIDGLHLYEQVIKDILNGLNFLKDNGVIVVHDCNPENEERASRKPFDGLWNGDVWKAIFDIKHNYKNVNYFVLDTDFGLGIITKNNIDDKFKVSFNEQYIHLPYEVLKSNRKKILNLKNQKYFKKFLKNHSKKINIKVYD